MEDNNAREYALNVLKDQIKLLEDAYNAGYNDAIESIQKNGIVAENGMKFIDLGLNDGLLWSETILQEPRSIGYNNNFQYQRALEYGLPTKEQLQVFFAKSKKEGLKFTFPNGHVISIPETFISANESLTYIWVKSNIVNDEAVAYKIGVDREPVLVRIPTDSSIRALVVRPINKK